MKRIIISLAVVGAVAAAVVVGTTAFFSDTETSTGNTFTAGTIDIAVDKAGIPWSQSEKYVLADMKPSQVDYTNFTIRNTGTNPVNVWKKVSGVETKENGINEPECLSPEYNGTWTGTECTNYENGKNDIDSVITYDLSVVVKDPQGLAIWNQTLFNMNKTVSQIATEAGYGTFLGMIPARGSMDVTESYHMKGEETGNWAQSDEMEFDITVTAEQLKGTAVLEDKDQVAPWRVLGDTARKGTLTYGVKDSKFNYSFNAVAMTPNTPYSLVAYHELFSTPVGGPGFPRPVTIIGSATADGTGVVTIPQTSVELGTNLLNIPVWLVKTADLSGSTLTGWTPSEILFDTGLIDYYDTDL